MLRKKCSGYHTVNWQLGTAGHKRSDNDGHFPVTLTAQCTGGHDSGHTAAKANQHWHKASARQADFTQQLIHNKRHPGHIPAVLQQRQEEKQRYDHRKKGQYASHTVADTVYDQRLQPVTDLHGRQQVSHLITCYGNPILQQRLHSTANRTEGQIENAQHDQNKNRYAKIFMCQQPVNFLAAHLC